MARKSKQDGLNLTKRQRVLFERLVKLGELAKNDRLPVKVTSIKGFGSFFRGKSSPKDVDVVIWQAGESPQFDTFIKLKKQIRGTIARQRKFSKPVGAFLEVFDQSQAEMLPGLLDAAEQRSIYESWLEGWSWQMLYPETMSEQIATEFPAVYLRRLLRRVVPNVNIPVLLGPQGGEFEKSVRTGFLVEIWTPARSDMRANLIAALAPSEIERYLLEDCRSLQIQAFEIQATHRLLSELSRRLRYELSDDTERGVTKWLDQEAAERYGGVNLWQVLSDDHLLQEDDIAKAFGSTFTPKTVEPRALAERVEQLRELIRERWLKLEALRLVTDFLARYRFGRGSQCLDETLEQFVLSALAWKKRYKLTPEIDDVLKSLELPRLSAWNDREWRDATY